MVRYLADLADLFEFNGAFFLADLADLADFISRKAAKKMVVKLCNLSKAKRLKKNSVNFAHPPRSLR
jgi:hypothetical protein